MIHSDFLTTALDVVQNAEPTIKQNYRADVHVDLKLDHSPVTIADTQAEQIIREGIVKAFPDHQILGEEAGQTNGESEYLWIIDPIDGTKNYSRQVPLFATELALMKEREIILGVSNAPAMHELVYAQKGNGAYCNGERIHVSKVARIDQSYLSFGGLNYFVKHEYLDSLLKINNVTRAHRGIGDAWSYHLLAQGKIDIVIEADVEIWDVAALVCIVREAGGMVTDIHGNPVTKETTSIVATNGLLHQEVLSFF